MVFDELLGDTVWKDGTLASRKGAKSQRKQESSMVSATIKVELLCDFAPLREAS